MKTDPSSSVKSVAGLPLVLFLDSVDLGDALPVSVFADLSRKPRRYNLAHLCVRDCFAS